MLTHENFEKGQKGETKEQKLLGTWWSIKDESPHGTDLASALTGAGKHLREDQSDRTQANLRHAKMYGNFDLAGFGLRDYMRSSSEPTNKIALNVSAACVDTLTAKIAKNKPRPSFQTDGGSPKQQRMAKRLDLFCRGLFYETDIYREAVRVFVDACIFGTGALKIFDNDGRVGVERTFVEELFTDEADAIYGKPTQMLQRKVVDRGVLQALYAEDDAECLALIESAKSPEDYRPSKGFGDMVEVWEGWHLPSKKGAGDGRHVIAIEGLVLLDEEWDKTYFPFAFMHYKKRVLGFWGQGLVECISGIQIEINRLLRSISEQLRRKGRGRIFVHVGSKVVAEHLTNAISDVVFYAGDKPPIVDNANAVAAEEFMQLDRLYQRAFQEIGISELSAGGKKPSGLDAAVALREFSDIESERFAMIGKDFEQLFLDAAEIMIDCASGIAKANGGSYKARAVEKRSFTSVDWKDVDLERDAYVMQMFPVSSLPQTPAYRRQTVKELEDAGYITDKAEARRLLDFPDLENASNVAAAAMDDAEMLVSNITDLNTPKYTAPDEFCNLEAVIKCATAAFLRGRHSGLELERRAMLLKLIDAAAALIAKANQPNVPTGSGVGAAVTPPGMPPGMPPPGPGAGPVGAGMPPIDINLAGPGPSPAVPPLTAQ